LITHFVFRVKEQRTSYALFFFELKILDSEIADLQNR